jgi:hypothetical protein
MPETLYKYYYFGHSQLRECLLEIQREITKQLYSLQNIEQNQLM